jgi:hypothetical protein
MITNRQKQLIADMPSTEYGQALFAWIREELDILEKKEESGLKISDDPLSQDFRSELGLKIAYRKVLNKPKQCFEELSKEELR